MTLLKNVDPTEPSLDDVRGLAGTDRGTDVSLDGEAEGGDDEGYSDEEILQHLGQAKRRARNYQQIVAMQAWEQAEAAFRSEHYGGSKYHKAQYKNRAKYFKPKTRNAVRKTLTATASALFSSASVISTQAANEADQLQQANAELVKHLIDMRLNNKTRKSGVPWFHIALGAREQTQIMGVCASKQDWTYKVKEEIVEREEVVPVTTANGEPVVNFMTGEPMMQTQIVEEVVRDVQVDKPTITLISPEMVLMSPTTSWIEPAQNAPEMIVQCPMHSSELRRMMEPDEKNVIQWREVTDDQIANALFSENEISGIRAARDQSETDALTQDKSPRTEVGGLSSQVVDVWECFFVVDGVDYHCWSLRDKTLISDPVPVEDAYPAFRGMRPYVVGTDTLEPHVLYPESHVQSWKQAQDEINDVTNLRMDANRLSVYPSAKVRAGRDIDHRAVQRRDANGVILVRDQDDVVWDQRPSPPQGIYQEMNYLSNDFDGLAGQFDVSSVQSNRDLNETVGGMSLIASNANATAEFDLRCWIESWVEPVLSQLVMLEQYYEDDMVLLAVAGDKARLFQRFGISEITDELLEGQLQVSVDVGIGSSDPMQKLARFNMVNEMASPYIAAGKQAGKVELNFKEILSEIFGLAGFKNGAERFVTIKGDGEDEEEQTIPREQAQQMMQALQQLQNENQELKQKAGIEMSKAQMKEEGDTKRAVIRAVSEAQKQEAQNNADIQRMAFEKSIDPEGRVTGYA